jgi:hypothetical protein
MQGDTHSNMPRETENLCERTSKSNDRQARLDSRHNMREPLATEQNNNINITSSMSGSYVAPLLIATGPTVVSTLTADKVQAIKAQNDINFQNPQEGRRTRRKLEKRELAFTVVMGSIGGLAVLTGLLAMYIEASWITYIAFIFPLLSAPYSIHQRRRLNKMPSLVEEINKVRVHVNQLAVFNLRLQQENYRLAGQVGRLGAAELKLQAAVQESGGDVNEFQSLVRENGATLRKIKVRNDTVCANKRSIYVPRWARLYWIVFHVGCISGTHELVLLYSCYPSFLVRMI